MEKTERQKNTNTSRQKNRKNDEMCIFIFLQKVCLNEGNFPSSLQQKSKHNSPSKVVSCLQEKNYWEDQ
jgi:hypothetical protein